MSKMSKIDQIHIGAVIAMYVEDVEDIKTSHNRCILKYSKMSKIDQIHRRAVMLCMSKILKQAITGVY